MQRSCSSNRVSDKLNSQSSSSSKKLSSSASLPSFILKQSEEEDDFLLLDDDELPIYHPKSYLAMKYKSRLRFADSAIHIIPFLLIFSALLLWFFSKPVAR